MRPSELKRLGRQIGGRLVWSAVFVDAATLAPGERHQIFTSGFTIHDCPKMKVGDTGYLKDCVDPAMIEQMYVIADLLPVDRVLLCSEDRDYIRIVHSLRDAGKRVTVIVPSAKDNPELAGHADDTIVYADFAAAYGDVFTRMATLFKDERFGEGGGEVADAMKRLATVLRVLDGDVSLNSRNHGFLATMRKTRGALSRNGQLVAEEELKRMLEFLIGQGVMVTKRGKPGKWRGSDGNGRNKGRSDAPIHYRICKTHPFVIWAECGCAAFGNGAADAAERRAPTEIDAASVDQHPRVVRFRERYGMRATDPAPSAAESPRSALEEVERNGGRRSDDDRERPRRNAPFAGGATT